MTPKHFVIWLKGFSEACNDYHPTPKQWDRIKEVLDEVEDYNDYGDLDEEIDDWYLPSHEARSGSVTIPNFWQGTSPSINFTIASGSSSATTVWNDKMGNWHYTNYSDGFGYYHNPDNKKQQLND